MNLSYLSVVCKVIKSFHLKLNFRKGLSCYRLGLFFYIFTRILPGLLLTCKFLRSRSILGCQFDNFNIYWLHLETFFDNHLFLPPGAASMQLPVFSWIGVFKDMFQKNNQAFDRAKQTTLNDICPTKPTKLVCEVGRKTYGSHMFSYLDFRFHVVIKVLLPSRSIAKGSNY